MQFPEDFLWGEKWDGVQNDGYHSARGYQKFLKKISITCTGPVRTHFARPCQQLCEYLEQSGDKVYSISKIQQQ